MSTGFVRSAVQGGVSLLRRPVLRLLLKVMHHHPLQSFLRQ